MAHVPVKFKLGKAFLFLCENKFLKERHKYENGQVPCPNEAYEAIKRKT
jgi:hypothetical protein